MKTRLLLLAALLLAASCKRAPRVHQIKNLGNTPYQEDTIRVTYGRNPERDGWHFVTVAGGGENCRRPAAFCGPATELYPFVSLVF